MAAYFWVTGGTGNWNSASNWALTSGGVGGIAVPGSGDTAAIDANSGSGSVTLDISPTIQTLTCTGFTGTLAFGTNTISLNSTGTIFTGATTMTVTGTPLIICTNSSATARTITPTAVTEANSISFRITAGTGTLGLTAGSYRDLDFTDGTNPTGYGGALTGSTSISIYGALKASTNMTVGAGSGVFTFAATSGTKTINTAAVVFDKPFTFNGIGGTFQLASALASGATRTATLTNGTLDLASYTLTTGLFTTNASNATTLAFGTGNITLSGTGTIFTGSTTCTVTGTPQVICTDNSATARTILPGVGITEANSISFRVTAGTGTFTISTTPVVRDLDFTDGVNPTGFQGSLTMAVITIYGNFKASTGMTCPASGNVTTFAATSGTKTINTAGVTFDRPFTFNGVGGTFQLQDALTSGSSRTATLTNGTLDLNGYTFTCGSLSSNNSNVRTLAFGATGKFVLLNNTATLFSTQTATNLTVTGTAPLIQATTAATTGTRTIIMGAAGESNAISLDVTAGSDTISLQTTSGAYKNVNFTGFTGTYTQTGTIFIYGNWNWGGVTTNSSTTTITFAATSGTKTITSNSVAFGGNVTFDGAGGTFQLQDALTSGATRTATLTNGTLDLNGYTLTTGLFTSGNTNTRVLAFGTGKLVIIGLNASVYSTATATGLTLTGSRTVEVTGIGTGGQQRSLNGGSTGAGGSAANAPNFYITAGADVISLGTVSRAVGTVNFTGFSGSTLVDTIPVIYGSLVLSTGMTVTAGTGVWTFAATTSQTITTNGKTLDFPVTFNGIGGTWTCQDALTLGSTQTLTLTNGTLKLAAGTTSTVGAFATSGTNQKFLQSSTDGTQATISDASGTDSVTYLTIQDSNATGGAAWDANDATNVNAGNNTGWFFAPTPSVANEIEIRLRSFTQPRRF